MSMTVRLTSIAAVGLTCGLSGCWLADLHRCRDIDEAVCETRRLGEPPRLYAEIDEADRTPHVPGSLLHAWYRCGDFTWEQYGLFEYGGGGFSGFYENDELVFSTVSDIDPSQQCDQAFECGDDEAARFCTPYCLWWDYLAGTEFAELPPGDPGWCEDSPWKDFMYEP